MEEDITEFVESTLKELTIMVCFRPRPEEQRSRIELRMAIFENYLTERRRC